MKSIFTFIILLGLTINTKAQDFQEISTGAGYNKQSYIKLNENSETLINNDSWDLMFTAFGLQDAGIFINESAGSSMGQVLPEIELYDAKSSDFNATPDIETIKINRMYNTEESWNFGAFNENKAAQNPFDFGWGIYNPPTNSVIGNKVYVIKLRNGEYRKIIIESLTGTSYQIKHAKLDGSDIVSKSLNKISDSYNKKFILYKFDNNSVVNILPEGGFDMVYSRYSALATDPNGTIVQQYIVTGVVTGLGVETAEVDGVNPSTVKFDDYKANLSPLNNEIGYDWKTINATFAWEIDQDKVFFVKTADKKVWKIHFIDFEGSSTGKAVFEKTNLGDFSSSNDLKGVETVVYPNPMTNNLTIALDIISDSNVKGLKVNVSDVFGNVLVSKSLVHLDGFSVIQLETTDWLKGVYFVEIVNENQQKLTKKVFKL